MTDSPKAVVAPFTKIFFSNASRRNRIIECLTVSISAILIITCCGDSTKEIDHTQHEPAIEPTPKEVIGLPPIFRGADWLSNDTLLVIESNNLKASVLEYNLMSGAKHTLILTTPILEPMLVRIHPRESKAIVNPFYQLRVPLCLSWDQDDGSVDYCPFDSSSNIDYIILQGEECILTIEAADVSEVGRMNLMPVTKPEEMKWSITPLFSDGVIRNDLYIAERQGDKAVVLVRWLRQEHYPPEPPEPTHGISWCLINEQGMIIETSVTLPKPVFTYRGLSGTISTAYTLTCDESGSFSLLSINRDGLFHFIGLSDINPISFNGMVDLRLSPDKSKLLVSTGTQKAGLYQVLDIY